MRHTGFTVDAVNRDSARRPGKTLLYIGSTLFLIGVLAIVSVFVIAAVSDAEPGLPFYLVALAAPIGLLIVIAGALRTGRRSR